MSNLTPDTSVILEGIGTTTLIYSTDNSMLFLNKAQDAELATSATQGKQYGGDGMYPLLEWISEKTGKFTLTNATFSLNQAKFAQGGVVNNQAEVHVNETKTPASGTCQLGQTQNILIDSVICVNTVTGSALTQVTGTPTAGQYAVTAAGVVTVPSSVTDALMFDYYYTDNTGVSLDIMNDSVAGPCEVRHSVISPVQENGHRYKTDLRIYSAQCIGNFTYSAKRGAAFSPKLELEVLDSGRTDNKNMTYNTVLYS